MKKPEEYLEDLITKLPAGYLSLEEMKEVPEWELFIDLIKTVQSDATHSNNKDVIIQDASKYITPEWLTSIGFSEKGGCYEMCVSEYPDTEYKKLIIDIDISGFIKQGDVNHTPYCDDIVSFWDVEINGAITKESVSNLVSALKV